MDGDLQKAEYDSLREEILGYIRQRFDVMVVVVTASALLIGYGVHNRQPAVLLSIYLLLLLAISHMGWSDYYAFLNASYLRVFHEGERGTGWEGRLARFRLERTHRIPQSPFQLLYWGIAVATSVAASFSLPVKWPWYKYLLPWAPFVSWALFALFVGERLFARHADGPEHMAIWQSIREEETQRAGNA